MKYEKFKAIIDYQISHNNKMDEIYKCKVDLLDVMNDIQRAVEVLWEELLTEDGNGWLNWYLYDKDGISGKPREDLTANDSDGKEICKDLKGLHAFLVKEKYFIKQQKLMKNKKQIESVIAHLLLILGITIFLSIPLLVWAL